MSDEHMNANKYLKGRFINIGNIITDTTNNWQFKVEMKQTNEDSCFADTISVLTFLNQFAEENEELKSEINRLNNILDKMLSERTVIEDLQKENEQLKQSYDKLKQYHSNLHDECTELECSRDRYRNDVLSLEKENEQLKQSESVDFMNRVLEENEQLKNSGQYEYDEHKRIVNGYVDKIKELKKENEELKQQLADEFNQSTCITLQKSKIIDLEKENGELKYCLNVSEILVEALMEINKSLGKENEQLKQQVKQLSLIGEKQAKFIQSKGFDMKELIDFARNGENE